MITVLDDDYEMLMMVVMMTAVRVSYALNDSMLSMLVAKGEVSE